MLTPIQNFAQMAINRPSEIERWFRRQYEQTPAPFYASVDLRRNHYRFAPVDTNLFPAGFNNLSPMARPLLVQALSTAIVAICPNAGKLLLIPENHTRNLHYWANLAHLKHALETAGVELRLGSTDPALVAPRAIDSAELPQSPADGKDHPRRFPTLWLEPIVRQGETIGLIERAANADHPAFAGFSPCMVLLNNDLSAGFPEMLRALSIPILPSPHLGWHTRRKSDHFAHYAHLAQEFAQAFDIPADSLQSRFRVVEGIDFHHSDTLKPLAEAVSAMINELTPIYAVWGKKPYIVIKSDSGTYGMAVMAVHSGEEILNLNRKARNKLAMGKEGLATHRLILQEGIYSMESVEGHTAEETLYMVGRHVVGGFYRLHSEKDETGILNAPGMQFRAIPFSECCHLPNWQRGVDDECNRLYVSSIIARLAGLAAGREAQTLIARN